MDIQQVLTGFLTNIDKTSPNSLLKNAAVVDATVLSSQPRNSGTLITLQIQQQVLQLVTPQHFEPKSGQKLSLQLISQTPVLTFKLLVDDKAAATDRNPRLPEQNIVLKQWFGEKTTVTPSPALRLKDLSKLPQAVDVRFEVTSITKKTVEGNIVVLNKNTVSTQLDLARLKLDRHQINIDSPQRLKAGNSLLLRLDPNKPDRVQASPIKTSESLQQAIQQALRTQLPQQQSSPVVLKTLSKHIDQIIRQPSVPEALKNIAREILLNLPKATGLVQPEQIKQSVEQSGIFLEARLAGFPETDSSNIKNDFKAKLLRLFDQLNQQLNSGKVSQLPDSDRELLRQIQQKTSQVLARIVVDQLQSLPKEEGNRQVWLLEIPFLNQGEPDKVRLEIEQQQTDDNDSNEGRYWAVNITVTPPGLGTVYCKILCIDHVVSTRFWSESVATTDKINRFMDVLKQQLQDKGLKTGIMTAEQGKPNTTPLGLHQLLNEKA